MLASRDDVAAAITFFVAFHVLNAIDNIYAEAILDFTLREAVEHPIKIERDSDSIKMSERSFTHKFIRVVYVVLEFLFISYYYYFLPYTINFIPYFFIVEN